MTVDYLIIGQGIAGTLLSHFLIKEGKSITVIDNPQKSASSRIAGGLYNPVVFKRMAKSWKADTLMPFAIDTYGELGERLQVNPLIEKQVLKIFSGEQEIKLWEQTWQIGDLDNYITGDILFNPYPEHIYCPFGASVVLNSGAVEVNVIREAFKKELKASNRFLEEDFELDSLKLSSKGVEYKGIMAQKIIFCEGYLGNRNSYFDWLPLLQTKGEVLIIEIEDFEPEHIVNKNCFILPLGDGLFKVGATFEWEEIDEIPTQKGREELEAKLKVLLKAPYKIVDQQAGVRPTVKDRRPLIGLHPEHSQIGVFNGLGTKGVMLAPYFAQQFVQYLENGMELLKEVDIRRLV